MKKYVVKLIIFIILITLCGCARNKEESASIGFEWNIVKRMDTFFKYISMERQNYACLSI